MKFERRLALFSALLVLPGPLIAQAVDDDPIIVTGQRLQDTERALKECLVRKCPPEEDINATLAHAESLFVSGDYEGAQRVTRASLRRNGRHAKAYPVPVSDLYRAHSRISIHLGEGEDYRRSSYAVRRVLKEGLAKEDPRQVTAELEVAGMEAGLNRIASARRTYARAERRARSINRPDLAAIARVRGAWLHLLEGNRHLTRAELAKMAVEPGSEVQLSRLMAKVLLARLDRWEGKTDSSDELIEELRTAGLTKPTLLFSPPLDLSMTPAERFDDNWVDIGFWVNGDGRVSDVEILRKSGRNGNWIDPLLRSIAGRIYAPMRGGSTAGSYRVERYTYTSLWNSVTQSRIRQRSSTPRVEFLDLTAKPEDKSR